MLHVQLSDLQSTLADKDKELEAASERIQAAEGELNGLKSNLEQVSEKAAKLDEVREKSEAEAAEVRVDVLT